MLAPTVLETGRTNLEVMGPITEGLVVQHLCGNSLCCNPDHLAVVAISENTALRTQYGRTLPEMEITAER